MVNPRDVTPVVRMLRNHFNGRQVKNHLRFEQKMSARDPPPPVLPRGPSHVMSANSYSERDGRRIADPPKAIYAAGLKQIASGAEGGENVAVGGENVAVGLTKPARPGFGYDRVTGLGHTS